MRLLINTDIFDRPLSAKLYHHNFSHRQLNEILSTLDACDPSLDEFNWSLYQDAMKRYCESSMAEDIEVNTGTSADLSTAKTSIILPGVIFEFDKYDLWRNITSTDRIMIMLNFKNNNNSEKSYPDFLIQINPFELYDELPMKNSVLDHEKNIWLICMLKDGEFYTSCRDNAVRFIRTRK